ncbi:MAG: hypothetical protein P8J87_17765 [Verrucomicrobiales bacterium]|nr:hypothetical protein [Verrucomicrobiales bacterium]
MAAAVPIARLDTPAQIWHVTDRGEEEVEAAEGEVEVVRAEVFPEGVSEVLVEVGLGEAVNVGITAFQIRPVPLQHGKYEAYLQVALSSGAPEAIEAELSFTVGEGIPVPRRFDLEPGGRTGLVQTLEGGEDQILRMRVSVAGDRFALDDVVVTRLPEVRPVTVMWVGPEGRRDPFTGVVLGAIATEGELDVWKATPEQWPPADVPDVVLFDGWVPEEWPAEIPAVVLNPPGASGPVRAVAIPSGGVPHELVRVTNEEHPLLFRVSSGRVALTQTSVIDTSGSLEPLWFAGSEPVLAAGEVGGQRLVLMAFSPQRSEQLPLTASYPLLIGNAIYWCAEGSGADGRPLDAKTGTVVDAGESGILSWRELRDGGLVDTSQVVPGRLAELDRLGLWETGDGRQGSAMLLSRHETNLGGASAGGSEAEAPGGGVGFASVLRGEVTAWLLGLVLVVLLVESWLFHRHSVY